jgi:hypothetical protein
VTWDRIRRAVTFVVGVVLTFDGVAEDPTRGLQVAAGLVLMGLVSVDQLRAAVLPPSDDRR